MKSRSAEISRKTRETDITVRLGLDGSGQAEVDTGLPFLNHMLDAFFRHGMFDIAITAKGDLEVDDHHLVEDLGICLGQAFCQAVGRGAGIRRYGSVLLPFDETLIQVAVDISGRPYLACDLRFACSSVGGLSTEAVGEFLRAFAVNAGITLHVRLLSGGNTHHVVEALFKGLGRALREAIQIDERHCGRVPSTKGSLDLRGEHRDSSC